MVSGQPGHIIASDAPIKRWRIRKSVAAASLLLALWCSACGADSDTPKAESAQERGKDGKRTSWTVRQPPLLPYDPDLKHAPNSQRERRDAPMEQWTVVAGGFATATDCERSRKEQYAHEYGHRAASMQLYLDSVFRGADPSYIAVLHRRAAEDSGHDDQLDSARCILDQDVRLGQPANVGAGPMYLLVPPTEPDPGEDRRHAGEAPLHLRPRFDAPLSRWDQLGAYDSATACEVVRHARAADLADLAARNPKDSYTTSAAITAAQRCVDPADATLHR